jgi:cobaltochelatase CobS
MVKKATKEKELETVEIAGVSIPVRESGLPHVFNIDPSYQWPEQTYDVVMDLLSDIVPAVTGHAGCGKSSIFKQIGAVIKQPVIPFNCNGQMTVQDLVGNWVVKGGETVWVDGTLPYAMKNGYWVIIEEMDCADPSILSALNSVMEPVTAANPNRVLLIKEKGNEAIVAHPDFRIMLTGNTLGSMQKYRHLYPGTQPVNFAMLDRVSLYLFRYLDADKEVNVLVDAYKTPTNKSSLEFLVAKLVEIANMARTAFENEEIGEPFTHRRLHDWIKKIIRHKDRKDFTPRERVLHAAESTLFSRTKDEEREVLVGIINRVFE